MTNITWIIDTQGRLTAVWASPSLAASTARQIDRAAIVLVQATRATMRGTTGTTPH
jgi:hypothetical protein